MLLSSQNQVMHKFMNQTAELCRALSISKVTKVAKSDLAKFFQEKGYSLQGSTNKGRRKGELNR